ncbi:GntR family transcriptional regulator [Alphaproteobacteria bacterium]|nr:GntR family transcriptional regulator [Alphaproteobacteria bacterium]
MSQASERAYEAIKSGIIDGRYLPGERLGEELLVQVCSVSRTPVREALRRLAFEGYVVSRKNSGFSVAFWEPVDVEEVFHARALLEGYLAALAAQKIKAKDIAKLEVLVENLEVYLESGGYSPEEVGDYFMQNNAEFHDLIRRAAGNHRLLELMRGLAPPPIVQRTANTFDPARISVSNAHHRDLVIALKAHNSQWAQSIMRMHVQAAAQRFKSSALKII